jgi:hypothetical protein
VPKFRRGASQALYCFHSSGKTEPLCARVAHNAFGLCLGIPLGARPSLAYLGVIQPCPVSRQRRRPGPARGHPATRAAQQVLHLARFACRRPCSPTAVSSPPFANDESASTIHPTLFFSRRQQQQHAASVLSSARRSPLRTAGCRVAAGLSAPDSRARRTTNRLPRSIQHFFFPSQQQQEHAARSSRAHAAAPCAQPGCRGRRGPERSRSRARCTQLRAGRRSGCRFVVATRRLATRQPAGRFLICSSCFILVGLARRAEEFGRATSAELPRRRLRAEAGRGRRRGVRGGGLLGPRARGDRRGRLPRRGTGGPFRRCEPRGARARRGAKAAPWRRCCRS